MSHQNRHPVPEVDSNYKLLADEIERLNQHLLAQASRHHEDHAGWLSRTREDTRRNQDNMHGMIQEMEQLRIGLSSIRPPVPKDCPDCNGLANELEALKQQLSAQASRHHQEHTDWLRRTREETQRNQDHLKSISEKENEQKEQLHTQLFTAWKVAAKFVEAEKMYRAIMEPLSESDQGARSDLMYEFADMMLTQKNYVEAEKEAQKALNHRKSRVKTGGQGSQEFNQSHRQLSSALRDQNLPEKQTMAIAMHRDIWENGFPHDWKAENGDRLSQIYADQGKYLVAQTIQQEVWKYRMENAGTRDEATLNSAFQRIAMLDDAISKSDEKNEKEFFEKETRKFIEEVWNSGKAEHKTNAKLLAIGHRLGEAYYQEINHVKAGEIFEQVWVGKKSLDDINPETLKCGHRLGEIHYIQEKYAEAEIVFDDVWNRRMGTLGINNLDTLASGHRLGEALYKRSKYAKAEDILKQVWEGKKKMPVDTDLETLECGNLLGEIHCKQKHYAKAGDVFEIVWEAKKTRQGNTNADTLNCGDRLGEIHCKQKEWPKAETVLDQVWNGRKSVLRDRTFDTLAWASGHRLGEIHFNQKKYSEAEKIFDQVWNGRENTLGRNHRDTLESGHKLGETLYKQNKHAKAEEVLNQVWSERKNTLGKEDSDTLNSGHQLAQSIYAQVYSDKAKCSKGKPILKDLWETRKPVLEDPSSKTISSISYSTALESLCLYGALLVNSGDFARAEKVLRQLMELQSNPAVKAAQLRVEHFWGVCLAKQGRHDEAREALESVLSRKNVTYLYPRAENCLDTSNELEEIRKLRLKARR